MEPPLTAICPELTVMLSPVPPVDSRPPGWGALQEWCRLPCVHLSLRSAALSERAGLNFQFLSGRETGICMHLQETVTKTQARRV